MAIVFKKALCKNVADKSAVAKYHLQLLTCLLYTSPSPRDCS